MTRKALIKAIEFFNEKYYPQTVKGNQNACLMALGYLECYEQFARLLNDEELMSLISELQYDVYIKMLF